MIFGVKENGGCVLEHSDLGSSLFKLFHSIVELLLTRHSLLLSCRQAAILRSEPLIATHEVMKPCTRNEVAKNTFWNSSSTSACRVRDVEQRHDRQVFDVALHNNSRFPLEMQWKWALFYLTLCTLHVTILNRSKKADAMGQKLCHVEAWNCFTRFGFQCFAQAKPRCLNNLLKQCYPPTTENPHTRVKTWVSWGESSTSSLK